MTTNLLEVEILKHENAIQKETIRQLQEKLRIAEAKIVRGAHMCKRQGLSLCLSEQSLGVGPHTGAWRNVYWAHLV
jgi:hypothetical protein